MAINRINTGVPQAGQVGATIAAMPFWKGIPGQEVVDLIVHETRHVDFSPGEVIARPRSSSATSAAPSETAFRIRPPSAACPPPFFASTSTTCDGPKPSRRAVWS